MEENSRNQLDAKLKEMIKHFEQAQAKGTEPIRHSAGAGNAIRRREGQESKRFYVYDMTRAA